MRDGLGEPEAQRIEALLANAMTAREAAEKATLEEALRGLEDVAKDLTSMVLSRAKAEGPGA
jgi:hypothetical protein